MSLGDQKLTKIGDCSLCYKGFTIFKVTWSLWDDTIKLAQKRMDVIGVSFTCCCPNVLTKTFTESYSKSSDLTLIMSSLAFKSSVRT